MVKAILFSLLFMVFSFDVSAAPKADLWVFWDISDENNRETISHQLWSSFLNKNIHSNSDNNRLLNYKHVSKGDVKVLNDYLSKLKGTDPRTFRRDEQFAYWVNLYNALTVQLILENYPIKSITKLGGFFSFGPWDGEIVQVAGQSLTLNDIEHRILRPIWKDKRIHYAVNCASLGCPNLQAKPYNALTLNKQLDAAAKEFINADKGLMFAGNTLVLSSIYDWYSVDFGDFEALREHLLFYLEGSSVELLKVFDGDIDYQYDWRLNESISDR
jgi:hypothetical protein